MSVSKTNKTAPASALSVEVRLTVPTAWHDLTQEQLRYILTMLADGVEGAALKTYALVRFNRITVYRRTQAGWQCSYRPPRGRDVTFSMQRDLVASMLEKLKFIDSLEDMDVRLDGIHGLHAVDGLLHGVPFGDYLKMELAYQGYMKSRADQPLRSLARLLYRDADGHTVSGTPYEPSELLGAYLWFAHVKQVFAREFPVFFRPAPDSESIEEFDPLEACNAQIRALTDGDITKETIVMAADTWRALTELNAKSIDAREMRAKLAQKS